MKVVTTNSSATLIPMLLDLLHFLYASTIQHCNSLRQLLKADGLKSLLKAVTPAKMLEEQINIGVIKTDQCHQNTLQTSTPKVGVFSSRR